MRGKQKNTGQVKMELEFPKKTESTINSESSNTKILGAVDCGLGGAIAWYDGVEVRVKNMPKDEMELFDLLEAVFNAESKVYVEYQSMRAGDSKLGKFFNTSKLIVNFKQILMILKRIGIEPVIISAHTWQKKYSLPLEYADKKRELVRLAKLQYARLKPSLKTADALLILHHARLMEVYEK